MCLQCLTGDGSSNGKVLRNAEGFRWATMIQLLSMVNSPDLLFPQVLCVVFAAQSMYTCTPHLNVTLIFSDMSLGNEIWETLTLCILHALGFGGR